MGESAFRRASVACCEVGLDRPLIPTAFVANLLRSARASRPRRWANRGSPGDALTVEDWQTCGLRGRAGSEALPGPSRFGGELFVPPYEGGIQGGSGGPAASHAPASPRSPRWDNRRPCLASHTGNEAADVRGLMSTRRGSEGLVMIASFWPGACVTRPQQAAPFGSWPNGGR